MAGGLANTSEPALIAVGQVTATCILALVVHLLLGFPSGRVRTRPAKALVGAAYFISLVLQAPLHLFAPGPPSPYTALRIRPDAGIASTAMTVQQIIGACLLAGVIVVLAGRLREAAPRQRRVLGPVFLYGMVVALGVPLSAIVLDGSSLLAAVQVIGLALVPVAFLVGIRLGGFPRTAELDELGAWLGSGERGLTDAVAAALGDDSVELAFWSSAAGRFVDGSGAAVELPAVGSRRAAVELAAGGRRVGAIVYDATVIAEPETVRAAGRVVALALEHERMGKEIAAAGDTARRQIAQDLHDGLQSRLVLLAMRAGLDGQDDLRGGLETVIGELRELVEGTMPAILVERGLFRATEDLVEGMPVPVDLELVGDGHQLAEAVQTGAYFVVAEALTNAIKHSEARELGVRLERRDGALEIEVRDDGVGGAAPDGGAGLRGMAERIESLGGHWSLHSRSGDGTQILVEVPCG